MSQPRLQLSPGDFDAYLPERATSNAYSRPRIEVKQRAMAWARRVAERLLDQGFAASVQGSDEHPSLRNKRRVDAQWVFFCRDEVARDELERLLDQARPIAQAIDDPSPYTRHAFLALRIHAEGVEVCFAVHPDAKVDVDNLRARLATAERPSSAEPSLAEELMHALTRLPEQFQIGTDPADRAACELVTPAAVIDMLERAAAGQVPLWIGWSVPRDVALEHAETLDDQLADAIVALAPVYRLVAWSRENDHVALDRQIQGMERDRARTHAELAAENERWRAERAAETERVRELAKARSAGPNAEPATSGRRPSLATLFKGRPAAATPTSSRPPRSEAGPPRETSPAARETSRETSAGSRETAPASRETAPAPRGGGAPPSHVIEKGSRVSVLTGPFADKVGVVSELDGRGGARVLLGLLSTRLDLGDLELVVDPRDRPPLQVSHHRPAAKAR